MSHYADYLREKTKDFILETPDGFATYRFLENDHVYLIDLFVVPLKRRGGAATAMADQVVAIAKKRGSKVLVSSVVPSAKGSTDSLRVLLAYGMTLSRLDGGLIIFRKDI